MIASYNPPTSAPLVNPLSQWEDDGGPPSDTQRSQSSALPRINIGGNERTFSALIGGGLVAYGLSRRSLPGLLTAIVGGGLVYRGMTGHCPLYDMLCVTSVDKASGFEIDTPETHAERQVGSQVSRGPAAYRNSDIPPMDGAGDEASVDDDQTGLPAVASCPASSNDKLTAGAPTSPSTAHLPEAIAAHTPGAEPQGRT